MKWTGQCLCAILLSMDEKIALGRNATWNGFYGSLNFRQFSLRNSYFFQPFSSPIFDNVPTLRYFENIYAYSLNQICIWFSCFLNFGFFNLISSFFNLKYLEVSSNFQFPRFLTIFLCSDILKNWHEYSLNDLISKLWYLEYAWVLLCV